MLLRAQLHLITVSLEIKSFFGFVASEEENVSQFIFFYATSVSQNSPIIIFVDDYFPGHETREPGL